MCGSSDAAMAGDAPPSAADDQQAAAAAGAGASSKRAHEAGASAADAGSPTKRRAATPPPQALTEPQPELFMYDVHVEVYKTPQSTADDAAVEAQVLALMQRRALSYVEGMRVEADAEFEPNDDVETINVTEIESAQHGYDGEPVPFARASHYVHLTRLCDDGATTSDLEMGEEGGEVQSETPACQQYTLPAREFHGIWESLVFDSDIKDTMLRYAQTAMLFSDRGVDTNLIGFNRVILLHGPPGTGKTSMCKALAQKLTVRLSHRYTSGMLIEVNAHSLFSRWFSESGKMVLKLFEGIRELAESDPDMLCSVVIDEVESLTASRTAAASGNEPSDAVRVVNALLTQLDQLKRFPNVLVLTTSNVTAAIDTAFTDRADLKVYVGNPSVCGRYEILRSAVAELARAELLSLPNDLELLRGHACEQLQHAEAEKANAVAEVEAEAQAEPVELPLPERASLLVWKAALACEGLSGRMMRKLPFLAHTYCGHSTPPFSKYIACLGAAAAREIECKADMASAEHN